MLLRLLTVVRPSKTQITSTMAVLLSAIFLIISIIFSIPLFLITKIQILFKDASYCYEVRLYEK